MGRAIVLRESHPLTRPPCPRGGLLLGLPPRLTIGDDIMGKKDEEIKMLRGQNADLEKERNGLEVKIERQAKTHAIERKQLEDTFNQNVQAMQAEVQKMKDHKQTLILSVAISGGEDITKALNDAAAMLKSRLEKINIADRYDILAIPSTFGIGHLR